MIKISVSVLMELSEDWKQRFADFQTELQSTRFVNERGEIHIPSYTYLDTIFEIARRYEIFIIFHS